MIKLIDILNEITISKRILIKKFMNYRGDPGFHWEFKIGDSEEWYGGIQIDDKFLTTAFYLEDEEDEWEEFHQIKEGLEKNSIPYEIIQKRDFEGFRISRKHCIIDKSNPVQHSSLNEITIFPATQDFIDALDKKGYERTTTFPNGLNLSNTKLKNLPFVKVTGNLNLKNTLVTRLPNNLKIYGNLVISGTLITSLPSKLKIRGSLYMRDVKLDSMIGDGVTVGYRVYYSNPENAWYFNDELRRKSKFIDPNLG